MARQARTARKRPLPIDVLAAARERIAWTFDSFPKVYVSFSGGKDSSDMLHLVAEEARRRGRRFGVLFIDLEAQYKLTIDHVRECLDLYADIIEPFWVALPIHLRNAVSMIQPYWVCWDPAARDVWVRDLPSGPGVITDPAFFPFFRPEMEFEEFVDEFGWWYSEGLMCACLVGIRADESLNRWRTIASSKKSRLEDKAFTTWKARTLFNIYPIYDWATEDIWTYVARAGVPYNRLYDLMHWAGLTIHQMRICQPYGDDQRRGLWLYHVIEPESWARVVARVSGANSGALYAGESGNILGNRKVELPPGHTWRSFVELLLDSLPAAEREHFEDKIAVFLSWYRDRGYPRGIPDTADPKLEAARKAPSWRRIAKVILKNDRLCKGLSFGQQRSTPTAYERYKKVMKRRRAEWGI